MKKSFILFFFPIFCFGQTSHYLDSTILYRYDTMNVLSLYEKRNYSFDANNNQTMYAVYNWDNMTNSWVGTYKYESIYDANNNQSMELRLLFKLKKKIYLRKKLLTNFMILIKNHLKNLE